MGWKMENKVYNSWTTFYQVKNHHRIELFNTFCPHFELCKMLANSICILKYVFSLQLTTPLNNIFCVVKNISTYWKTHLRVHLPQYLAHSVVQLDWTSNTSREKSICQQTRRVTTLSRPPLESSRRGESKSTLTIFVQVLF